LRYRARPKGTLTFHKDIAPIVFNHCVMCHRPRQAAPFSLLNYADVRGHAKQIAELTRPVAAAAARSTTNTTNAVGTIGNFVADGYADFPLAGRFIAPQEICPGELSVIARSCRNPMRRLTQKKLKKRSE
jgi:hypothetical protein